MSYSDSVAASLSSDMADEVLDNPQPDQGPDDVSVEATTTAAAASGGATSHQAVTSSRSAATETNVNKHRVMTSAAVQTTPDWKKQKLKPWSNKKSPFAGSNYRVAAPSLPVFRPNASPQEKESALRRFWQAFVRFLKSLVCCVPCCKTSKQCPILSRCIVFSA